MESLDSAKISPDGRSQHGQESTPEQEQTKSPGNLFQQLGFSDFKWIKPEDIVVSQWVRMKCTFGCGEYGHNATCPPNTPSVAECERFFKEYSDAAIFHFVKKAKKPEDRHAWSRRLNLELSKLDRISSAGWTAFKPRLRRHRREMGEVKPCEKNNVATFGPNLKNTG